MSYTSGSICTIAWDAVPPLAPTAWKNMTIELMTESHMAIVSLQTVATTQDGTIASSFNHTCPEVNKPTVPIQFKPSQNFAKSARWFCCQISTEEALRVSQVNQSAPTDQSATSSSNQAVSSGNQPLASSDQTRVPSRPKNGSTASVTMLDSRIIAVLIILGVLYQTML
ncbi:hypothetical protein C8J56DRAFT_881853 [Mycena floridula]|nr:hypothetical protein C8J56DRAFT_881853 [Mycena floridula]